MKTKTETTWKVIAAIGFLLLCYTMQTMAQEKPTCRSRMFSYNDDSTITITHVYHFTPDKIPALIDIFDKANKIIEYRETNHIKTNFRKVLGYVDCTFDYGAGGAYFIMNNNVIYLSMYENSKRSTFYIIPKVNLEIFTVLRDNYYRDMSKYILQQQKKERDFNSFLNKL